MPAPNHETLYLIDGSGFIFRAFHAVPDMTRSDGVHVNAVYGFCNMLNKLLGELKATRIAVVFDAARRTFRHDIYPQYKAHRPDPPPELVPQFALIREATVAYGIPAVEAQNYEADDLIAAYAKAAIHEGMSVRIVSSDKDFMQLIRDGVELFDPMKAIPIGAAEVLAKFGVAPDKVIDVQALAGDSSDNVPGVPGIGIKTAAQLIGEYGDLESLLAGAAAIKQPKRREALLVNAEQARISKRLVTLDADAPLPQPLAALRVEVDHRDLLLQFLQTNGFRSLIARIDKNSPTVVTSPVAEVTAIEALPEPDVEVTYDLIRDLPTLQRWVEMAREQGYVAIDTETDSLTPSTTKLIGVSLATQSGRACYIPVGHVASGSGGSGELDLTTAAPPQQLTAVQVADTLRDLLADPTVLKIGHNLKFDMQVLAQHGLTITPYDDTMLMSYVLSLGQHGHGLDELALLHFHHKMISFADVTGAGRNRITFDRVSLETATDYAAEDADFTLRLWLLLKPQLVQQHLSRIYERIERPLIPVVADMERVGVLIDRRILREQSQALAVRLGELELEIHGLAGHAFNIASPQQLGKVLFEEMGLALEGKLRKSAAGEAASRSTSHEVLEPLAESGHEIAAKVLDWRALAKLKSTYTDSLPEQIDRTTGRVHTSFALAITATGRLSSTDPNLQNIPIRTADGRAIRRAFVAPEGHALLSVDYSQIELRLAAEAAGISALIQAFHDGVDVHALTASRVFGLPLTEVTPERRRAAKAINFGIIYGISGFGLAKQIGCSNSEAGEFIKQYLDRFHELREWMNATKESARQHGFVETMFGRRVYINGMNDRIASRRAFAERQAINAPLQGTAADIMKRAMVRVWGGLHEAGMNARLLLQVHDELVLEVPMAELENTTALVVERMQSAPLPALTLNVPLVAEAGHGLNWAEAH